MNFDFLNEPRKTVESRILNGLVRVMTIEQYQCAKEIIVGMTDEEFFQFALESAWEYEKAASHENLRDFLNESRKMEIAMGITPQNSALNNAPSRILSKDLSDMLWKKISASQPHDVIRITYHDDDELMQLWKSGRDCKNGIAIPSDIFFAETIPLKDCVIEVDERDLPNGHIVSYRVVIFDYEEELKCADFDTAILVGAFVMPYASGHLIMPLKVVRGVDGIVGGSVCFHGLPDDFPAFYAKEISQQESLNFCLPFLDTWYGIQIALLHPTIKSVFRCSRKPEESKGTGSKKKHKHKVKYVKVHVINRKDLENVLYGEKKTVNRHALIWYVIGHWRVYESGKRFLSSHIGKVHFVI